MRETASFTFPPFRLETRSERLWQGDKAVRLTPKAFAVLRYLLMHAGQLVLKEELIDAVWATPYISPAALTTCMYELRQALGEQAQMPQFIETVRGRGYRFIAPFALYGAVLLYHHRQEAHAVQEWAEATIAMATEHEFPQWLAPALIFRGWAMAKQGQVQHGISQMQQGLSTYRAMQAGLGLIQCFGLMAETYGKNGQMEEGLTILTRALTLINNNG